MSPEEAQALQEGIAATQENRVALEAERARVAGMREGPAKEEALEALAQQEADCRANEERVAAAHVAGHLGELARSVRARQARARNARKAAKAANNTRRSDRSYDDDDDDDDELRTPRTPGTPGGASAVQQAEEAAKALRKANQALYKAQQELKNPPEGKNPEQLARALQDAELAAREAQVAACRLMR